MLFDYAITVSANTLEASPKIQKLPVTRGILHRLEVEQYKGCHRYVGCRIFYHTTQIFPTNLDGEFKTDGYTIAFDDYLELFREPYELEFRGYSDGSDYDHTIVIRIGILKNKEALLLLNALKGIMKFLKLVGVKV